MSLNRKNDQNSLNDFSRFFKIMQTYLIGSNYTKGESIAPGVEKVNTGLIPSLFYNVYHINPNPSEASDQSSFDYDIGAVLNELDNEPQGRSAYNGIDRLTGGSHLLADTSPAALRVRKILVNYLKPQIITQHAKIILEKAINKGLIDQLTNPDERAGIVRHLVLSILAKSFFNVDKLPRQTEATLKLASVIGLDASLNSLPMGYLFSSAYRESKDWYTKLNRSFLENQVEPIFQIFQSETPHRIGKNILADIIIDIIKNENNSFLNDKKRLISYLQQLDEQEIIHYLQRPELKSVLAFLIAADNISSAIALGISRAEEKAEAIKKECLEKYPQQTLSTLSFLELKSLDSLNEFYHEMLKGDLSLFISRYTQKGINLHNNKNNSIVNIPAGSYLFFDLQTAAASESCNRNMLFSAHNHKRACPGVKIAEILFKIILAPIVASAMDNPSPSSTHLQPFSDASHIELSDKRLATIIRLAYKHAGRELTQEEARECLDKIEKQFAKLEVNKPIEPLHEGSTSDNYFINRYK